MEDPSSQASPIEYHPDYNDPTDDVILQSSDRTLFRVHSVLLRKSSTVFADMLAIPQPINSSTTSLLVNDHAGPPPIQVQESTETLARCLSLITYRALPPDVFTDLAAVEDSARFFDKYGMVGGSSVLRILLARTPEALLSTPLEVYKLACACQWQEIIDAVAVHCIREDPDSPGVTEALRELHIRDYMRLTSLAYRRKKEFEIEVRRVFHSVPPSDYHDQGTQVIVREAFILRTILVLHEHPGGDAKLLFSGANSWMEAPSFTTNRKGRREEHPPWDDVEKHLETIVQALPKV